MGHRETDTEKRIRADGSLSKWLELGQTTARRHSSIGVSYLGGRTQPPGSSLAAS